MRTPKRIGAIAGGELRDVAALVGLTLAGLLLHGYTFGGGDQCHYIPLLYAYGDPTLFPSNDLISESLTFHRSFLWLGVYGLSRVIDLQWALFGGYVVCNFLILLAVFRLALRAVGDRRAAYVAVALFLIPKPAGPKNLLYADYFTNGLVALPVALFAVDGFLRRRFGLAGVLLGVAFLVHPITAAYVGCALALYGLLGVGRPAGKEWLQWAGAAAVVALPLIAYSFGKAGTPRVELVSGDWLRIVRTRAAYIFPTRWAPHYWTSLVPWLFVLCLTKADSAGAARLKRLAGCVLLVGIAGGLCAERWPLSLLLQLQPLRCAELFVTIGVILLSRRICDTFGRGWAGGLLAVGMFAAAFDMSESLLLVFFVSSLFGAVWRRGNWFGVGVVVACASILVVLNLGYPDAVRRDAWRYAVLHAGRDDVVRYALAAVCAIVAAAAARRKPSLAWAGALVLFILCQTVWMAGVDIPHRRTASPWREVQLWAKEHRPPGTMFVTPPDAEGFRIFSRRGQVVDHKDGARLMFSRRFALEWAERVGRAFALHDAPPAQFEQGLPAFAQRYGARFAVVEKPRALKQRPVFENERFIVYELGITSRKGRDGRK